MINWAYAANGAAPEASSPLWSFVVPMIFMVAIFYFLMIRPQQRKAKEHRTLLENLKKGDRVLTNGGLIGTIIDLQDQIVILEVADRVRVEMARAYIAGLAPKKGS